MILPQFPLCDQNSSFAMENANIGKSFGTRSSSFRGGSWPKRIFMFLATGCIR
jgi:hypothetical protein